MLFVVQFVQKVALRESRGWPSWFAPSERLASSTNLILLPSSRDFLPRVALWKRLCSLEKSPVAAPSTRAVGRMWATGRRLDDAADSELTATGISRARVSRGKMGSTNLLVRLCILFVVAVTVRKSSAQSLISDPKVVSLFKVPVKGSLFLPIQLENSVDVDVEVQLKGQEKQRLRVPATERPKQRVGLEYRLSPGSKAGDLQTLNVRLFAVGGSAPIQTSKFTLRTVKGGCTSPNLGTLISPLDCSQVMPSSLPLKLTFKEPVEGMQGRDGEGIGFTAFMPSSGSQAPSYDPSSLFVREDRLHIRSTGGDWRQTRGDFQNSLVHGLPVTNKDMLVHATTLTPPTLTGSGENFCLFLANSELNFLRICAASEAPTQIAFVVDQVQNGIKIYTASRQILTVQGEQKLGLRLEIIPRTNEVILSYRAGAKRLIHSRRTVSPYLLSKRGTIPKEIGTNSFVGVSSSSGTLPKVTWSLKKFRLEEIAGAPDRVLYRCTPTSSEFPGLPLSTIPCEQVRVRVPLQLRFDGKSTGASLLDKNRVGTGFTAVVPSTNVLDSFIPSRIEVSSGALIFESSSGNWQGSGANNLENALAVGLPLPNMNMDLNVSVVVPQKMTGSGERFCLFLAASEEDFNWVCIVSTPAVTEGHVVIRFWQEELDKKVRAAYNRVVPIGPSRLIHLNLRVSHSPNEVVVHYFSAGLQRGWEQLGPKRAISGLLLNRDPATLDVAVKTRAFAGIANTHGRRNVAKYGRLKWSVLSFSVEEYKTAPVPKEPKTPAGRDRVDFSRWTIDEVQKPTSMVFAPDGRLYVATLTGLIYALKVDHGKSTVVEKSILQPFGEERRMLLGITADRDWRKGTTCLWLAHSKKRRTENRANTSKVSKLCGKSLNELTDVIVGLPSSDRDHAVNNIHFGRDGKLYIAQGGNTGSGATNVQLFTFYLPEQRLSAAILVADVKKPGFQGRCFPPQSITNLEATRVATKQDAKNCDVEVYASGLRNTYDFAFHKNGHMYAADNALATSSRNNYPPLGKGWTAGDDCSAVLRDAEAIVANRPGLRLDVLHDIKQGAYYGHPNPSRGECVFYGGNPAAESDYQVPISPVQHGKKWATEDTSYPEGTEPEKNWVPPMMAFGDGNSPDGMIAYEDDAFCGDMDGDLLVTYWADKDQVRRIKLSADGKRVVSDEPLIYTTNATGGRDLSNPLGIAQDPAGNIYVGEFSRSSIYVMSVRKANC